MKSSDTLGGKTAIVTGAAGGIGAEVVRGLVGEGAQVVFCDVDAARARAFERELVAGHASVRFVRCDVTDEESVRALVAAATELGGGLDIAVNNVGGFGAGDGGDRRLHDTELAAWNATVALNLTSCFLCMKHQLAPMLAQRRGAIVNIASLAALRWSDAACPSYAAAKAGVIRLTRYAATSYAADGIRVNAVAPGLTATEAVLRHFDQPALADLAAVQPMRRLIDPSEVADAVLWACSDRAKAVTGLTIPVDGGWAAS